MTKKSKKHGKPNQSKDQNAVEEHKKSVSKQTTESRKKQEEAVSPQESLLEKDQIKACLEGIWEQRCPPSMSQEEWEANGEGSFELCIVSEKDDPNRFMGYAGTLTYRVVYDFRIAELHEGSNRPFSWTIMFTYHQEGEWMDACGGGLLYPTDKTTLEGIQLEHQGYDGPLFWVKISDEVPADMMQEWEDAEDEDDNPLRALLANYAPQTLEDLFWREDGLLNNLKAGGIHTLEQLKHATDEDLLAIKGIGARKLQKIHATMLNSGLLEPPSYESNPEQQDKVFRLRVTLEWDEVVWRDIEMLGRHTLHNLHEMIQVAFDWDDDHLYSFFMSGTFWDQGSAISHPLAGDTSDASEIELAALSLETGKRFAYLFDFGDEWRHMVEVKEIGDTAVSGKKKDEYPKITRTKGEAPPQYPDWDEDEE